MSEEIKEILDRLDFNEWEVDLYKVPITWSELYDIRDYITNLQKELDQYKNNWEELKKWAVDDLKEVYRDAGFRHKLILEVLDKMKELEERK